MKYQYLSHTPLTYPKHTPSKHWKSNYSCPGSTVPLLKRLTVCFQYNWPPSSLITAFYVILRRYFIEKVWHIWVTLISSFGKKVSSLNPSFVSCAEIKGSLYLFCITVVLCAALTTTSVFAHELLFKNHYHNIETLYNHNVTLFPLLLSCHSHASTHAKVLAWVDARGVGLNVHLDCMFLYASTFSPFLLSKKKSTLLQKKGNCFVLIVR